MSVLPNPHNTRSASAAQAASLAYSVESALDQVKSEVEKVSAANGRTEQRLQMLMDRLDEANVSLLSMCT
jgi:UDP-N-acetylmuramyl pentapeptide synthase